MRGNATVEVSARSKRAHAKRRAAPHPDPLPVKNGERE
jgi:hypothetical protein